MARARTIKPGFFKNETLAECDPLARILFAGLWCLADREGRLENRPKRIKAELLPYDDCDVPRMLAQLEAAGFIHCYEAGGTRFVQVLAFAQHQNPHIREPASTIPAPDAHYASTVLDQGEAATKTEPARPISLSPLPSPERDVDEAGARKAGAIGVIQLFDEEIADVFGSELRRQVPVSTDPVVAQRWLDAGADFEICKAVFADVLRRKKLAGTGPPGTLKYCDKAIADALAERKRPMAEGNANGRHKAKLTPAESLYAGAALALAERERARNSGTDIDAAQPLLDSGGRAGGAEIPDGGLARRSS